MTERLRILLVEDSEDDAFLVTRALRTEGLDVEWQRVVSGAEMEAALEAGEWDVVLADFVVPGFGARDALDLLRDRGLDVPLIVVSGAIGEDAAVGLMKAGARDFVGKAQLARLAPAVRREAAEARDRDERRLAERLARERDRQYRELVESSPDLIFRLDPEMRIVLASAAAERVAGVPVGEMVSRRLEDVGFPPLLADRLERHARRVRETEERAQVEFQLTTSSGDRWYQARVIAEHDDEDRHPYVLMTATDITRLKEVEADLSHRALHDPLTGLPNRTLFLDRLAHALARLEREQGLVGVLFVDLDGFKAINDGYGHEVGDEVLLQAARRLTNALRPADTIARLGGDEFVVLVEDLREQAEVMAVGGRLLAALEAALLVEPLEFTVTASIGIACTRCVDDHDALLRRADAAMYRAKRLGRNRCEVFEESMLEEIKAASPDREEVPRG